MHRDLESSEELTALCVHREVRKIFRKNINACIPRSILCDGGQECWPIPGVYCRILVADRDGLLRQMSLPVSRGQADSLLGHTPSG